MSPESPGIAAGRPRMTRSARRVQLLDAAREVFGARGYHAAAMDEIAERAGVSKPVLYQHFPGKLDLYRALVQGAADDMVRTVRAAIRSTTDNKARVHATIQAYFDVVSSRDGAMRLVFETDTRATPEVAALVDRATSDCIDAVTEAVTTDAGLEPERARLLAVGLVGLSTTAARYWLAAGLQPPREDAITLMSQLAWRGIGGFPRQEG
ncbi:TetR/AcrR family transcriptional regulator [Actinomycetospora sp. CA-101289]|jgi:AcrR family transcriptional regulator|uniref:TetR/AcrR family transcriptional regulator n=1 Tax=Actinomycetospora sp. CA-101289 TaxID=3239893 RepID=UPI003D994016